MSPAVGIAGDQSPLASVNDIRVDVAFLGARRLYAYPDFYTVPICSAPSILIFTSETNAWLRSALKRVPRALAPAGLRKYLNKDAPGLPAPKVVSFDTLGLKEAWLRRRTTSWPQLQEHYARIGREFCQRVVRKGLHRATAVYGFKTGCLEIFQEARRHQIICLMEQNSAAHRILNQLRNEEEERWPDWKKNNISGILNGSFDDAVAQREQAEWAAADYIVCPSEFVISTLRSMGVNPLKCRLLPYGIDTGALHQRQRRPRGDSINLLFVGSVGVQKGVPYLLEALRRLDSSKIHCRLVGGVDANPSRLSEYARWAEVTGPVPRSEMGGVFDWADVLVSPSLCEGSALVTYEALSCGIPVITTPNSGSLVRDGKNGFIVPIRDPQALADRVDQLAADSELLSAMSACALECRNDLTSEAYGAGLLKLIRSVHQSRQ